MVVLRAVRLVISLNRRHSIGLIALAFAIPTITFGSSAVYGIFLNAIQSSWNAATDTSWVYFLGGLVFIVFPLLSGLASDLNWFFESHSRLHIDRENALMYADNMSSRDIAQYEDKEFSLLKARVEGGGLWKLQHVFQDFVPILYDFWTVVMACGVVLAAEWWFIPLILIGILPRLIIGVRHGGWAYSIWSSSTEIRRQYADISWRFATGGEVQIMKLFGIREYLLSLMRTLHDTFHSDELSKVNHRFRGDILARVSSEVSTGICLFWCLHEVMSGTISIGTFTFYSTGLYRLSGSASLLSSRWGRIASEVGYLKDIFKLLDAPPYLSHSAHPINVTSEEAPTITFEDVHFSYAGGGSGEVLKGVSFAIPPESKVAIVGKNGAGKSTVIRLLLRTYDPTRGRILVNGTDLREISLESWYRTLGVYMGGSPRFAFTIEKNISLGDVSRALDHARVRHSATAMEADEFVRKLELGYEQVLGKTFPNGVDLSWGQSQRISLSQLHYREPKVLVLDEPTSALDAIAERDLFEKILGTTSNQTTIFVSHRFSTVRKAPRILVLDDGLLVEDGSHDALIREPKVYAELYSAQAEGYR